MTLKRRSQCLASLAILAGLVAGCGAAPGAAAGEKPMAASQAPAQQDQFDLKLSEQQQQQLQAITQKYSPQTSQEAAQQQAQQFQQVLTADTVDQEQLAQMLENDRQQMIQSLGQTAAMMAEIRQVLSEEQRATFAQMQNSLAQQASNGASGSGGGAALPRAIASFMQDGDQQALQAAVDQAIEQLPSTQQVAGSLAQLSLDQRKQMFNQ